MRAGNRALYPLVKSVDQLERLFRDPMRANSLPVVEAPTVIRDELPIMQKLALLQMLEFERDAKLGGSLAKGIARVLRAEEDCQDTYATDDFLALKDRGYAERLPEARYFSLTPLGVVIAERMVKDTCAARGIHHLTKNDSHGPTLTYRCLCGKWTSSLAKTLRADAVAGRQFGSHVATARGAQHQDEVVG